MKNEFINVDLMPVYIAKPSFINFQLLFSFATLGIIAFFFVYLPITEKNNELSFVEGQTTFLTQESSELSKYVQQNAEYQDYLQYKDTITQLEDTSVDFTTMLTDVESYIKEGSHINTINYVSGTESITINATFDTETNFMNYYWDLHDLSWITSLQYSSLSYGNDGTTVNTDIIVSFAPVEDTEGADTNG